MKEKDIPEQKRAQQGGDQSQSFPEAPSGPESTSPVGESKDIPMTKERFINFARWGAVALGMPEGVESHQEEPQDAGEPNMSAEDSKEKRRTKSVKAPTSARDMVSHGKRKA